MSLVVIYLHGFLSSPKSEKASLTKTHVQKHLPDLEFEIPELSNYPLLAVEAVEQVVNKHEGKTLRFIGSSMGGFLSTFFVEKYGGKAVLINPAVKPFELLTDYLGPHTNPYTNVDFLLNETHIHDLLSLDVPNPKNQTCYKVLLQTGDETLDYRQAEQKYSGASLTIEPGGDHSFQGYERHLNGIFNFLLGEESKDK